MATTLHPENKRKRISKDDDDDDPLSWQTEWAKFLRRAKTRSLDSDKTSPRSQIKAGLNHEEKISNSRGKYESCSSNIHVGDDSQNLATNFPTPALSPLLETAHEKVNSLSSSITSSGTGVAPRLNQSQHVTTTPYQTSHHHHTLSQQARPTKLWVASSNGDEMVDNKPKCPPCQRTKVATTQCRGGPPCRRCAARGWPESVCQSHDLIPSEFLKIGRQLLRKGAPVKMIRPTTDIMTTQNKDRTEKEEED